MWLQVDMHFRADVGSCLGTFYGGLESSPQADAWFQHMHDLGVHHFHAYVSQRAVCDVLAHHVFCACLDGVRPLMLSLLCKGPQSICNEWAACNAVMKAAAAVLCSISACRSAGHDRPQMKLQLRFMTSSACNSTSVRPCTQDSGSRYAHP